MFVMMNEARQLSGLQGFSCASSSYLYALNYARERVQGRHLLKTTDKNAPPVPIIEHPDVRRQLLTMKVYVEGMRSLLYYHAFCTDKAKLAEDPAEKARYQGLIEVLTPIVKGYVTDRAFDVCNHGIQVFGGYGYIKEYPMEQLLRDCRITMLYEGTNGIQAMDLLGRKLGINKGQSFRNLLEEMNKTIAAAKTIAGLEEIVAQVENALKKLAETALHMGTQARSDKVMHAYATAYAFMETVGDVVMAWMLLWRATEAAHMLGKKKKDTAFYEGQLHSAEFFIEAFLPVTIGKMNAILGSNGVAVKISEASFGGK
jgi:hypothetical protein